jgi:hypothetical protein
MGIHAKEKPGYDAGLLPGAIAHDRACPPINTPLYSTVSTVRNTGHRDGTEATVLELFNGKVRVDMNGDSNG